MTEAEWLASTDPRPMLEFLRGKVSDRKMRLFAVACWHRAVTRYQQETANACLVVAAQWADGQVPLAELKQALGSGEPCTLASLLLADGKFAEVPQWSVHDAMVFAYNAGLSPDQEELHRGMCIQPDFDQPRCHFAVQEEHRVQASFLADIFGTLPFGPVSLSSDILRWNDGTVPKIAQAIYDNDRFTDIPILADALEDAGCDNADILAHCRDSGQHARGCWVLDLLLGRS